jgi:conjugative relaxase-like TrwC/TraI family protein
VVTSSSGNYFVDVARVWQEAMLSGMMAFWVGFWKGAAPLPNSPTPQALSKLFSGVYISHRQANRTNCFDLTYTLPKSVSIFFFGLHPPEHWKTGIARVVDFSKPDVERLLANQIAKTGAQGRIKLQSQGIAAGIFHPTNSFGKPHGHIHYAVANTTVASNGQCYSIGNTREMYLTQGERRARFLKLHDQALQSDGIATVRVGKHFEIAAIPQSLIDALSPSKAAMEEARRAHGFSSARANDFYARAAKNHDTKRELKLPIEIFKETTAIAKSHGITLFSVTHDPQIKRAISDPYVSMQTAVSTAKAALRSCNAKYGTFTETQFRERLYTLALGKPTRMEELDRVAHSILQRKEHVRLIKQSKAYGQSRFQIKSDVKQTKVVSPQQSWKELKAAITGLRDAVVINVLAKAKRVVEKVTAYLSPKHELKVLDAKKLDSFIRTHLPKPRLLAHAQAIYLGLVSPGNPHQKALVAERRYRQLRQCTRLSKRTVLVIKNSECLSSKELGKVLSIAKRDKASIVFSEQQTTKSKTHQHEHQR